jgi:hypothetical protein
MNKYLSKLASDYERAGEFLCSSAGISGLKKITGPLIPGARVAWCYEDDVEFWKSEELPMRKPENWPYRGFIIPFPETSGRHEMEPEHVCLVITDYPVEKENPVTDWSVLALLFESPDLHKLHVFEKP